MQKDNKQERKRDSGRYNEILNVEDNFSNNNEEENSEDSEKNNNFISYDVFEPFIRKKKGKLKELIQKFLVKKVN